MDSKSDNKIKNVLVLKKEKRSVREMLTWLNETLQINITKLSELRTGAEYCQLMHKVYPSAIALSKVYLLTNITFEIEANFRMLRNAFEKLQLRREVPHRELIRGLGHYDFLNWFYKFVNSNSNQRPYNALKERKGKPIGFKKIPESDRRSDYGTAFRRSNTLLASVSPRKPLEAGQRTKSFSNLEKPLKQPVSRESQAASDGPVTEPSPAPPPLAHCIMPGQSVPPPPQSCYYMPPLETKTTPSDTIADTALLHPSMPAYYMSGQPVPSAPPYYFQHMQPSGEKSGAPSFPYYYAPFPFMSPDGLSGQLAAWSAPTLAYEPAKSVVQPPNIYETLDSPVESEPHKYEPLKSIEENLLSLVNETDASDEAFELADPFELDEICEPAEPFELDEICEPAEPFEPASEPAKPIGQCKPYDPTKLAKLFEPAESAKPSESATPAKPCGSAKIAKVTKTSDLLTTLMALATESDLEDEADDRIWEVRSSIALLKDKLMTVESIIVKYSGNSSKVMRKLKRYFRKQRANESGKGSIQNIYD